MVFCVFCEIANNRLPHHIIWEDEEYMAILGIFPNTKGMSVVFPKRHQSSYAFEADDRTLSGLILSAKKVAQKIDKALPSVMRTGLVLEGYGIDHLHAKLFPLHGKKTKGWRPIESRKDEFFVEYPGYISSHDSKRADDKELEKLAKTIRES